MVVVAIDVSKVSLEVWVDDGPAKRFDNSTDGIAALAEWLKERDVSEAQPRNLSHPANDTLPSHPRPCGFA